MPDLTNRLVTVLELLPVAVGLISSTGRFLGKAGGMSKLLGDSIPSYDGRQAGLWTMTDAKGGILPTFQWPSARALRGERDYAGTLGVYRDQHGQRAIKVISVPTLKPDSEIAAVGFLQVLDTTGSSADGSHFDLQQRLIDELAQAVAVGWDAFNPLIERINAVDTTKPR